MDGLSELVIYIERYGYIIIFLCVFLQEIGVPNPITNELVLLFCGFLAYENILNIFKVFLVSVAGDLIGTCLLYAVFYFFSKWLILHGPGWLHLNGKKMQKLKVKISRKGFPAIITGRMIPFIRGYISVAAGILRIKPRIYLPSVIFSALIWSGGLVMFGMFFGHYLESVFHFKQYLAIH